MRYLTWVELERLLHHVLDDGVLVGRVLGAHLAADVGQGEGVPGQTHVPARRVLQQVPHRDAQQPQVALPAQPELLQDSCREQRNAVHFAAQFPKWTKFTFCGYLKKDIQFI